MGIIRHSDDHFVEELKDTVKFQIINAGAGKFEHPSQTLLDLFTIQEEFGSLENLTITICGDILNSRVARSNIKALEKFNSKLFLTGPTELLPDPSDISGKNTKIAKLDDVLETSDVVMFLRVQHERHDVLELNINNYNKDFGLNDERYNRLKDEAIIMHPGPVNRDVEIASHLVEEKRSRIFKQKENGVYTRMAILEWLTL